jgi:hypothetical protein
VRKTLYRSSEQPLRHPQCQLARTPQPARSRQPARQKPPAGSHKFVVPPAVVVSSSFTLTARLAIAQDLGEMVLEVTDVVGHEVIESGGPFSRYLLPGELVEIVLGPRTKPLLARR